jgi:hypothetical protein
MTEAKTKKNEKPKVTFEVPSVKQVEPKEETKNEVLSD